MKAHLHVLLGSTSGSTESPSPQHAKPAKQSEHKVYDNSHNRKPVSPHIFRAAHALDNLTASSWQPPSSTSEHCRPTSMRHSRHYVLSIVAMPSGTKDGKEFLAGSKWAFARHYRTRLLFRVSMFQCSLRLHFHQGEYPKMQSKILTFKMT